MTNPVGRSSSSPPSNPNPNQPPEGSLWGRIGSFLKEIFSRYPQPEPSPATFSSDVSSKEVGLSKDVILRRWVNSQPENAKAEAAAIVAILKETNLDNPFELDLSNKRYITSLPDVLQNCKFLNCFKCTNLQSLPTLPECRELNCSGCASLQALPELPVCEILACSECANLQEISELPACKELYCLECTGLQSLPALSLCTYLDCSGCTSLQTILELPVCSLLVCADCTTLQALPKLPLCTELNCYRCTSLETLPALPVCEALGCQNCTNLQEISELPACKELYCSECTSLQEILALPKCITLDCRNCGPLKALPELPLCTYLDCSKCTNLQEILALPVCETLHCRKCRSLKALPELPVCNRLNCSRCTSLETLPSLPLCVLLDCAECTSLQALPELPACKRLVCPGCTSLQALPALPKCITLDCRNCRSLEALPNAPLLEELFCDGCPDLVVLVWTRIRPELCTIGGVKYFPIPLPDELRAQLAPPIPDGASIKHLQTDLRRFIAGLIPGNLPVLRKEMQGVAESGSDDETLKSYIAKLTTWEEMLFSRLETREPGFGTPKKDTEELTKFYENIEYYLLHLDGFLSKEQNRDAFVERLRILQTQNWCGARFIGELEQLFSLNCVSIEHATLQNQFAQIASTEAKRAIERMYPGGDVHNVNQAMFQLSEFLTGSYIKDQLSHPMDQEGLMFQFLKSHTSTSLVETILIGLKPSSPMEEVFADYLKENFSPELTQDKLQKVQDKLTQAWNERKESKIAQFNEYQRISKIKAEKRSPTEKFKMQTLSLTEDEKACKSEESLGALLDLKEKSFKEANFKQFVQAKKDEILYQDHFDEGANKWKPEIIAKALQKMGILATLEELIPKP